MKNLKENVQAVLNVIEMPFPSLGVDIDGVITDCTIFFQILTKSWPGKVYVISYRDDREKAEQLLKQYNIRWDKLILVNSFNEKAEVIKKECIAIFFDDQPEMLKEIAPNCNVMLVRNEGNFDFNDKKWMFSNKTGKII